LAVWNGEEPSEGWTTAARRRFLAVWNGLTFHDVHSLFQSWMKRRRAVIKNERGFGGGEGRPPAAPANCEEYERLCIGLMTEVGADRRTFEAAPHLEQSLSAAKRALEPEMTQLNDLSARITGFVRQNAVLS
jgi:hypothetical protein